MKRTQQGMTVIETLAALAIATMLMLGLSSMVDSSLDDVKGQQTALHQAQVVNAARKYISAHYADLVAGTAGTVGTITVAQLKTGGFLPDGFSSTNVYNQTPCVLVRQPSSGKLDALVATYGGQAIPELGLRLMAMQAGQGGGYISSTTPGTARGASWTLVTTDYRNVACDGATVLTGAAGNDGGHLVSSLFYDGPGQLSTDFLYRNAVPGRPELNQMNTPIHMVPGSGAQAVENDSTDPRCTVASGTGKIAVDAFGRVLSCQAGVWKRQGSAFWRDPVATYADLPATGNNDGDVRMVTGLKRGFTWNGTGWTALAVDQNGDLQVPGMLTADLVKLNQVVVNNAACSDDGMIARDATGLTLSCQSGRWRSPLDFRLTKLAYSQTWTVHVGDGSPDFTMDIASLPGARPLYVTGYAHCYATGFPRAYAYVNLLNAAGENFVYIGGCMSRPDSTGGGVLNKGIFGLQEIPENATQLHFHLEVEQGAAPEDYIDLTIKIYNSE